jgi:pimeloyl-ACP methyl ester carboxylesterase
MSRVSRTVVTHNGISSPVLTAGPRNATEAVVFLHGNPGPAEDWRDLVSRAGEFALALAPDMPGYGGADKPKNFRYTIDGYASHLNGLLQCLRVTRAHLVLHDFGGPWGLAWAVSHPRAFASVTLINTGVLPDYRWHHWARVWRTPMLGELFQLTTTRAALRFLLGRENPRLPREQLDRLYDALGGWPTKRAVLKLYRATPAAAARGPVEALRELNRPALVVWGTKDTYLPARFAERQRDAFPEARVELLDGAGHWPFLEDPDRVAELVIPFLREQVDPVQATAAGLPLG